MSSAIKTILPMVPLQAPSDMDLRVFGYVPRTALEVERCCALRCCAPRCCAPRCCAPRCCAPRCYARCYQQLKWAISNRGGGVLSTPFRPHLVFAPYAAAAGLLRHMRYLTILCAVHLPAPSDACPVADRAPTAPPMRRLGVTRATAAPPTSSKRLVIATVDSSA